jgi:carboxyl-terminal processing protease
MVIFLLFGGSPAAGAPAEKSQPPKDDYYELYKTLVDALDQVERNYVKQVDRRELFEGAIKGVLSKLDPYSSYIPPDELSRFRSTVESEFGGIGIQIAIDGGQLKVLSPLVGTPAYRAGLTAGDRILEIEGKSTDGLSLDEAVARLKGKEGSTVTLTLVHPGKSRKEKTTIVRERIHVETVLGDRRKSDDSWDLMLDPQEKIGYVRLSAFSRDSAAELRAALEELQGQKVRGLILDLRFNPGGLLSSAIEVSNLFISKGRIVSTKGRSTPERVWNAHKNGAFEGFPMAVLVNRYSASASEIVAACLQDHQRAVIMGERTWGKGSVQNVIELENGRSALKLTTASYRRPSGKNIHRFEDSKESDEWGVKPNQGFELKLGESDIVRYLQDRRQRDIVRPNHAASKTSPAADSQAEDSADDETETTPSKTTADVPQHDDNGMPQKQDQVPPSEKATAANDHSQADAAQAAFQDRQLQMAIQYLSGEFARAK